MRNSTPMSSYRSTSRNWIKLWVNEWLDGTTRLDMGGAQRAFWCDLLALGGRSRVPGVICSGETNGTMIGYPIIKLKALALEEINIEKTLALFVSTGKIAVKYSQGVGTKLCIITILNWEKYQSEYHRQRKFRQGYKNKNEKVTGKVTSETTERCAIEGEGEGEGEKSAHQKTMRTPAHQPPVSACDLPGFALFWEAYPRKVGKPKALRAWLSKVKDDSRYSEVIAGLMAWKGTEQWAEERFIPHPATFLNDERWKDEAPKNGTRNQSKAADREQSNRQAIADGISRAAGDRGGTHKTTKKLPA